MPESAHRKLRYAAFLRIARDAERHSRDSVVHPADAHPIEQMHSATMARRLCRVCAFRARQDCAGEAYFAGDTLAACVRPAPLTTPP